MRDSEDGSTIFQYEFLCYLKSQEALRSWTDSMKKSFKEAKTRARHYQAPFDGKSQVNAKKSIDFSERMETNTTSPQVHKRSSRLSPILIEVLWKSNAEKTCSQV